MKACYWGRVQCNTEASTTTSKDKRGRGYIVHIQWRMATATDGRHSKIRKPFAVYKCVRYRRQYLIANICRFQQQSSTRNEQFPSKKLKQFLTRFWTCKVGQLYNSQINTYTKNLGWRDKKKKLLVMVLRIENYERDLRRHLQKLKFSINSLNKVVHRIQEVSNAIKEQLT